MRGRFASFYHFKPFRTMENIKLRAFRSFGSLERHVRRNGFKLPDMFRVGGIRFDCINYDREGWQVTYEAERAYDLAECSEVYNGEPCKCRWFTIDTANRYENAKDATVYVS